MNDRDVYWIDYSPELFIETKLHVKIFINIEKLNKGMTNNFKSKLREDFGNELIDLNNIIMNDHR